MDLLDEKVLKKHRPDLIEYMKVSLWTVDFVVDATSWLLKAF